MAYEGYQPLKITFVGHSQIPEIGDYDGHSVRILKQDGAMLKDLYVQTSPLFQVWTIQSDVIVLFLGGNDLVRIRDEQLKWELDESIKQLQEVCQMLYVTHLEWRDYSHHPNAHYRENNGYYQSMIHSINTRLVIKSCRAGYRTIRINQLEFADRQWNNIHLTPYGKENLIRKWKKAIEHFISAVNEA